MVVDVVSRTSYLDISRLSLERGDGSGIEH